LAQFKPKNNINKAVDNGSVKLGKKANISRVFPPILLRSSKKVLENSKFHKGKGKANVSQANTQNY